MHKVHWPAFLAALVLAPILPAVPGGAILLGLGRAAEGGAVIVLMLPIAAVWFGVWTYVPFGAAMFYRAIRRSADPTFTLAALSAHAVSLPVVALVLALVGAYDISGQLTFVAVLGVPFSLLWGAVFGALYRAIAGRRTLTPPAP